MENKFSSVEGVDIFELKAYMETVNATNIIGNFAIAVNELTVNLLASLLNAVVGFNVFLIGILENIDVRGVYQKTVYLVTKDIYNSLFSADGLGGLVLAIAGIYLFWIYLTQNGRFIRKLFHILAVLSLGAAYFGTIGGQDAGLWAFQKIENMSREALSTLETIEVTLYNPNATPDDVEKGLEEVETVKFSTDFSKSYIEDTSFKAFLFINTGSEKGVFGKGEEVEELDLSKMLGEKDEEGNFVPVSSGDREAYLKKKGESKDSKGANVFQYAVFNYLFHKVLYLGGMIIYALVKGLPFVFIKALEVGTGIVVLLLSFLVPVGAVLSFIPYFQNMLFNTLKKMMAYSFVPALTTFILGLLIFIERLLNQLIKIYAIGSLNNLTWVGYFKPVFQLYLLAGSTIIFYTTLWKNKGSILGLFLGQNMGHSVSRATDKYLPDNPYKIASDGSRLALTGASFGAGMLAGGVFNGIDKFNQIRTNFSSDNSVNLEEYRRFSDAVEGDLYDSPIDNPELVDDQLGYDNTIDGDFEILEEQDQLDYQGQEGVERLEMLPSSAQEEMPDYAEEMEQASSQEFDYQETIPTEEEIEAVESIHQEHSNQSEEPEQVSFQEFDYQETVPTGEERFEMTELNHDGFLGGSEEYSQSSQHDTNQETDFTSESESGAYSQRREPKMAIPVDTEVTGRTETIEHNSTVEKNEENPYLTEAEELSKNYRTRRQQKKMSRLEQEIKKYDEPDAMYKASGSNAFTRGFRQSMGRDMRIKANIERRDRLMEQLERLRAD